MAKLDINRYDSGEIILDGDLVCFTRIDLRRSLTKAFLPPINSLAIVVDHNENASYPIGIKWVENIKSNYGFVVSVSSYEIDLVRRNGKELLTWI